MHWNLLIVGPLRAGVDITREYPASQRWARRCAALSQPDWQCFGARQVRAGHSLLVVGPSGAGKTSTLRAVAGLWTAGRGSVRRFGRTVSAGSGGGDIFFLPQVGFMCTLHM